MARISAYEATDGSLHRDRKAYIRHESNLLAAKKISALVEAQHAIKAAQVGVGTISLTGPEAISAFIVENLNELREILAITFKPGVDTGDDHADDACGSTGANPEPTAAIPEPTAASTENTGGDAAPAATAGAVAGSSEDTEI